MPTNVSPATVTRVAGVALALLALRGKRWAYAGVVVLGLLYFPAQAHFQVHAPKCDLTATMTTRLLVLSLQNYAYVALFAGVYWMSWVQFRRSEARFAWALLATLLVGAAVEVAQGMAVRGRGVGPCRLRDLIPDAAGALGAAVLLALWSRLRPRRPGYVRVVRPRPAVATRPAAAPPRPPLPPPPPPRRPAAPPREVAPLPRFVPLPPDFSPGPAAPPGVTPRPEVAPTTEVVARPEILQRFSGVQQRLRAIGQRLWTILRGRRRAIVVVAVLLALVGGATFIVLLLPPPAPAPTAVEQPKTAPTAPPPRPLQADAEGYYEPSYNFTVADRRFTRLTLRPEPFVTFSRPGTRQKAGCEDARIGPDAVHLRCELEAVGTVTIDGRFLTRFVTSSLDQDVLSAVITVTNNRGETLYSARDSFRWHEPD